MHMLTERTTSKLLSFSVSSGQQPGELCAGTLYEQVNRPRGGARNRKVDQEMIDQMIATVEEHPEFTPTSKKHFQTSQE